MNKMIAVLQKWEEIHISEMFDVPNKMAATSKSFYMNTSGPQFRLLVRRFQLKSPANTRQCHSDHFIIVKTASEFFFYRSCASVQFHHSPASKVCDVCWILAFVLLNTVLLSTWQFLPLLVYFTKKESLREKRIVQDTA